MLGSKLTDKRSYSIYEHIQKHITADGTLSKAGQVLPDEHRYKGPLSLGAGAHEGAFQPMPEEHGLDRAKKAFSLLQDVAHGADRNAHQRLYEMLCEDELTDFLDPLMDMFVERELKVTDPLYQYILRLALKSADRGPVKMGIALLGLIRDEQSAADIRLLGRHDAFTLFAAVALANITEKPEEQCFELARHVHGWGRIQMVERLADSENPNIREWLLREGYRNNWNASYQAYTCAVKGGLDEWMARPTLDQGRLLAAGQLLEALIEGGHHEDLLHLPQAEDILGQYLQHLHQKRLPDPNHYEILLALKHFFEQHKPYEMNAPAFSEDSTADLLIDISQLLRKDIWQQYSPEPR